MKFEIQFDSNKSSFDVVQFAVGEEVLRVSGFPSRKDAESFILDYMRMSFENSRAALKPIPSKEKK